MSNILNYLKIIDKVEKPVAINEAVSLSLNATGDTPDDVTSMLGKIINLSNPAPVTTTMMPQSGSNLPIVKTIADVGRYADEAGRNFAGEVGEEWDNAPDPDVADVDTMTKDLSGGLNREKEQYKKEYPGDNPMSVKETLMREYRDYLSKE